MKWIYRIFSLFKCPHKWDMVKSGDIFRRETKIIVGVIYTLRCKRCGDIKIVEHIA